MNDIEKPHNGRLDVVFQTILDDELDFIAILDPVNISVFVEADIDHAAILAVQEGDDFFL